MNPIEILWWVSFMVALIALMVVDYNKLQVRKMNATLKAAYEHQEAKYNEQRKDNVRYMYINQLLTTVLIDLAHSTNKQSIEWKLFIITQIEDYLLAVDREDNREKVLKCLEKMVKVEDVNALDLYLKEIKKIAKGYFCMEPKAFTSISAIIDHLLEYERNLEKHGIRKSTVDEWLTTLQKDCQMLNLNLPMYEEPAPEPDPENPNKSLEELMEDLINAARSADEDISSLYGGEGSSGTSSGVSEDGREANPDRADSGDADNQNPTETIGGTPLNGCDKTPELAEVETGRDGTTEETDQLLLSGDDGHADDETDKSIGGSISDTSDLAPAEADEDLSSADGIEIEGVDPEPAEPVSITVHCKSGRSGQVFLV